MFHTAHPCMTPHIHINGNESVAGNDLTHIRISQHIRKQCSKGILYNFMISTHLKYIFISLWSRWWIIHFIWEKETQFIDAVTRTIKNKRCSVLGYWESFYGPLTFPKDEWLSLQTSDNTKSKGNCRWISLNHSQSKMGIVDMLTAFIIFLPWIRGL